MEVYGLQTHLTLDFYPSTLKLTQEYSLYFSILEKIIFDNIGINFIMYREAIVHLEE